MEVGCVYVCVNDQGCEGDMREQRCGEHQMGALQLQWVLWKRDNEA